MADITLDKFPVGGDSLRLNAIFVHGLDGDSKGTWCIMDTRFSWPEELAKELNWLAVYTIGYPAGSKIYDPGWPIPRAATGVRQRLGDNRELGSSQTPIVFICHSRGGLIFKRLVVGAKISDDDFLYRIAGVVFLATPRGGSRVANAASWILGSDAVRDMKEDNPDLIQLSIDYANCAKSLRLRELVYYETKGVGGVVTVVKPTSAIFGMTSERAVPVGRDHKGICKPPDRRDTVYEGVRAFLEKIDTDREKTVKFLAQHAEILQHAAKARISEAAVRQRVEWCMVEGIEADELVAELERWIEKYQRDAGRHINEDEAFKEARQEADRRFRAGLAHSSSPLVDEFAREERAERERQEESRRRRIRLLEEAVHFDELDFNGDAAAQTIRRMAEVENIAPEALGAWLHSKALEFGKRGDEKGENAALLVAIAIYREALKEHTRERAPVQWASVQGALGNTLLSLGERENGPGRLEEALNAYNEALQVYTRELYPDQWAQTRNCVGGALWRLGERENGPGRLEEALDAFNEALQVFTRESYPEQWAGTQHNIGNVFESLSERTEDSEALKKAERAANAEKAFNEALQVFTRESYPKKWASTQNSLGNSLGTLGESGSVSGTETLKRAINAYGEALKEWMRERAPLDWAGTQRNLGKAS